MVRHHESFAASQVLSVVKLSPLDDEGGGAVEFALWKISKNAGSHMAAASGRVGTRAADSNGDDSWMRDRQRQLIIGEKRPIGAAPAGAGRAHQETTKPSPPFRKYSSGKPRHAAAPTDR